MVVINEPRFGEGILLTFNHNTPNLVIIIKWAFCNKKYLLFYFTPIKLLVLVLDHDLR